MQPDGNLDDEDHEHIHAVVDRGPCGTGGQLHNGRGEQRLTATRYSNWDRKRTRGPRLRGRSTGLVLFRNELTVIYLPGRIWDARIERRTDRRQQRRITRKRSARPFANTVDNYRSLRPLVPRQFLYRFTLPTQAELQEMGITSIKAPLHVHAQIELRAFPAAVRAIPDQDHRAKRTGRRQTTDDRIEHRYVPQDQPQSGRFGYDCGAGGTQ